MKDKNTIINEMVQNASHIMQSKVKETEMIIQMLKDKGEGDGHTVQKLESDNEKTKQAIKVMQDLGGCWA